MAKLILFQGVAGAGKSTLVYYNAAQSDTLVVNLDAIREELTGDAANQSANKEVLAIAKSRTIRALEAGRNVIIDSTLTKNEYANAWLDLASAFGASVGLVFVKVELATALARNAARPRQVPAELITQMYNDLQKFDYSGFDVQVIDND